jgi:hypothetical protein
MSAVRWADLVTPGLDTSATATILAEMFLPCPTREGGHNRIRRIRKEVDRAVCESEVSPAVVGRPEVKHSTRVVELTRGVLVDPRTAERASLDQHDVGLPHQTMAMTTSSSMRENALLREHIGLPPSRGRRA